MGTHNGDVVHYN